MKRITKFAKLAEQLEQAISAHVTEGKGAFSKDKAMKVVYRRIPETFVMFWSSFGRRISPQPTRWHGSWTPCRANLSLKQFGG
jgi:hypothetical protein